MTKEKEFLENHEAQSSPVDSFVASVVGESYNPDVLSCLANLSNDEVFTPPNVVNQILDALPQELFRSPDTTFLDPVCKSGVFLREIAKRLILGLQDAIPDLRERLDHIYKKQLFGIAITELTSLVSRRTLYCSMCADSPYSIVRFPNPEGNIRFKTTKHTWVNGKCSICGAAEAEFGDNARRENKENHAYEFIHHPNPLEIFKMKFDVIVGNPPYQISDGGAQASALPLYDKFVEKAKSLDPNYLVMIIPARWYSGGKGLDGFRDDMLNDEHLAELYDFQNASDCFPNVEIKGGVCYFLWDKHHKGNCKIVNFKSNNTVTQMFRQLKDNEGSVFIRFNDAVNIVRKVRNLKEPSFSTLVSPRKPFGLESNFKPNDYKGNDSVKLYGYRFQSSIKRNLIPCGKNLIDEYKVFISYAYGAGENFPHQILNNPFLGEKGTACTETYLVIGPFENREIAKNVITYIKTRFFRFLVLQLKQTQHGTSKVYKLVPMQDFTKPWTDAELYAKYQLTPDEIAFIESMIRPME